MDSCVLDLHLHGLEPPAADDHGVAVGSVVTLLVAADDEGKQHVESFIGAEDFCPAVLSDVEGVQVLFGPSETHWPGATVGGRRRPAIYGVALLALACTRAVL